MRASGFRPFNLEIFITLSPRCRIMVQRAWTGVSSVGLWIGKRSDTRLHLKSYERTEGIVEVPDSVDKLRIAVCLVKILDIPEQSRHVYERSDRQ
jgi:hypothetical protein